MIPPLTLNNIAKALTILVTASFFICGLLDILDYIIVQILLFGSTVFVFLAYIYILVKEDQQKNRLEN